MSNDLKELKTRIFEDERVQELLEKMGCERVNPRSNRYEAMLPSKFGSSNTRSVQVFLSETLYSAIRSRGVSNIDIYGLVSYIVFDCEDDDSMNKNLHTAKRWICETLNYPEYLQGYTSSNSEDPLKWLKDIKRQRPRELREVESNQIYEETILEQYVISPYYKYYLEGLSHDVQREYQIGYDLQSDRVIFPIKNEFGEIISVKGRTIDEEYKDKNIPKFMYLYNFNKMIIWYNWHLALYYILEQKEVIVFEAEKSCWYAAQYNHRNTLAIGGSDITMYQIDLLKRLPYNTKIILAFDKDKDEKAIRREADKFGFLRPVYTFWDSNDLLSREEKMSPTDAGKDVFEILYNDSLRRQLNKQV